MPADHCVISGAAEADLVDIALYISAYNPSAALRLVADLRRFCATLPLNPARYRLREEYGVGIRVAVFGKYLVFYAERGSITTIERVLHGARHLDWVEL